ncbi:MAG TPA: haloalkane dehalogenase [Symbiobacteriaceae bacterium]|jgi:pimeloyl-ACP methyl ester carboxylesterase/uncharacterized protein (DUF1330 family)
MEANRSADLTEILRSYCHPQFDPREAKWRELFAHERYMDGQIVVIEFVKLQAIPTAKAGYDAYIEQVTPVIERAGGRIIKVADVVMPGVGDAEAFDYGGGTAFVCQYPSRAAYVRALLTDAYRAANQLRVAAIAEANLLIGRDTIPAVVRLLFKQKRADQVKTPRVDGKSPRELVEELLRIYPAGGADPTRKQLEALTNMPGFRNAPLYFINLYQFGGDPAARNLSGDEGHKAYNRQARRQVSAHGAFPYFRCEIEHHLLGPVPWDLCVFVRWPSCAVFTDLRLNPEYIEAQKHRVTSAQRYGNFVTIAREDAKSRKLFSPAAVPDWNLADSPVRPGCVPPDGEVEIHTTEAGVRFVRTPEERFANLPGYPFSPHYALIEGLRMHYVDEGPADGEVVLMLHGQPTWSYLYRKMIPPLAAAGYRVIAVDHIGMGRSDKPVDLSFHTFEKHVGRLKAFIAQLGLKDITLFCQDWGSLIGLRVAGDQPDLFARIVVANGNLPILPKGMNPFRVPNPVAIDCTFRELQRPAGHMNRPAFLKFFQRWILYALTTPDFRPSQVVGAMTTSPLAPEIAAAYDAPYPSIIYKAAVRTFPSMIAAVENQNEPAWRALGDYWKPFLFLAGEQDHNMGKRENQERWIKHVSGAQGHPHERYEAGHFIQEDIGPVLAEKVVAFMAANPLPQASPTGKLNEQMHGARYGEVLLVAGGLTHMEATVYNTFGLNACPDDQWHTLDAEQIKRQYKARFVLLNGPRYWLMDKVTGASVGREIVTFGGLQMRRMATVRIPLRILLGSARRRPYAENVVKRSTTFVYRPGREVYELVAPGGATYVMQSYSLSVDPTLSEAALKTLGARLQLPAGWQYRVRQLEQELALCVSGEARVIQDEFENSYQRV